MENKRARLVSAWHQFKLCTLLGLKLEIRNKERFVSAFLFAATILVVTAVCLGEQEGVWATRVAAGIYLALFLTLQITALRVFEFEHDNGVFDLLCTYPVSREVWFVGKFTVFVVSAMLVLLPTLVLAFVLHDVQIEAFLYVLGVSSAVVVGLSALGVLLATLVLRANARHVLYPIIYFPLTLPVLIAAAELTTHYLEHGQIGDVQLKWISLLLGFDVIYVTLGVLLYGELVEN